MHVDITIPAAPPISLSEQGLSFSSSKNTLSTTMSASDYQKYLDRKMGRDATVSIQFSMATVPLRCKAIPSSISYGPTQEVTWDIQQIDLATSTSPIDALTFDIPDFGFVSTPATTSDFTMKLSRRPGDRAQVSLVFNSPQRWHDALKTVRIICAALTFCAGKQILPRFVADTSLSRIVSYPFRQPSSSTIGWVFYEHVPRFVEALFRHHSSLAADKQEIFLRVVDLINMNRTAGLRYRLKKIGKIPS